MFLYFYILYCICVGNGLLHKWKFLFYFPFISYNVCFGYQPTDSFSIVTDCVWPSTLLNSACWGDKVSHWHPQPAKLCARPWWRFSCVWSGTMGEAVAQQLQSHHRKVQVRIWHWSLIYSWQYNTYTGHKWWFRTDWDTDWLSDVKALQQYGLYGTADWDNIIYLQKGKNRWYGERDIV